MDKGIAGYLSGKLLHNLVVEILQKNKKSDSNARFQSCASQHRNVELQLNYLISVYQLHQR